MKARPPGLTRLQAENAALGRLGAVPDEAAGLALAKRRVRAVDRVGEPEGVTDQRSTRQLRQVAPGNPTARHADEPDRIT